MLHCTFMMVTENEGGNVLRVSFACGDVDNSNREAFWTPLVFDVAHLTELTAEVNAKLLNIKKKITQKS